MVLAADVDHAALITEASRLSWSDVPTDLRSHAVRVFADTIGVIIAGARQPEIAALVADREPLFAAGEGSATALVRSLPRMSAPRAAFVNGTAGTFLELDEACPPWSHPAIHVLPAALAAAETLGSSGRELMTAFVAGYEVVARLFDAYRLPFPLHPHGHLGAVGAAVAVAMLRRADALEPAAIAASAPILTTWDSCFEGATVRNAWAGLAAEAGLRSNALAQTGFTGSRTALGTAFGKVAGEISDLAALTRPIEPSALRIGRNYFKFHSACAGTHPALDATMALGRFAADEVESVLVEVAPQNWKLFAQSRGNELSNRFSIPYAVAAAIVHGHTAPEAFRNDDRVARLATRVSVRTAPDLDAPDPHTRMPARVTVRAGDRTFTRAIEHPYGHVENPASTDRLREKFDLLTASMDVGLYDRLLAIEQQRDVGTLFSELHAT